MNAMTMGFPEAADKVKTNLDIIDVIQRHVILKKSGRNYTGLCPFHNDKNPSMNVSREKNLFKCFSCGVGGDALSFLMRLENKTYGDIIRELAQEQGITIISDGQDAQQAAARAEESKSERQAILTLNARSQQWFQNQLMTHPEASPVREYLAGRNINEEAIFRFGLGFAPSGWENLVPHLKNTEALVKDNLDILLTAGLASQKQEGGGYYDRFRHRLIVPINDEKGQVVAFGGRALSPEEKAKYLNSPETAVYHKSRVLYGFDLAKDTIRQSKTAIVMEGYFDVISSHLAGITQTVGSCGTALTEQQIKLLTRFGAETLYLAFDSDEAGRKAALSAIQLIEPYLAYHKGLNVKILVLPENSPYKDPDEYIRAEGGQAFSALLDQAKPFLEFKFDYALRGLNLKTPQGRVDAAQRLTPMLSAITQPILRMEMLARYSEAIGVSQEALTLEVRQHEQRFSQSSRKHLQQFAPGYGDTQRKTWNSGSGSKYRKQMKPTLIDNVSELRSSLVPQHVVAERDLLRLTLLHPEAPQHLLPLLEMQTLQDPAAQLILKTMVACLDAYELDELEADELVSFITNHFNATQTTGNRQIQEASSLFTELVFSVEHYAQALKLTEQTPKATWINSILQEAQQLLERLEAHRGTETLKRLARTPEMPVGASSIQSTPEPDSELLEIERQYQLYEQLKQRRLASSQSQGSV